MNESTLEAIYKAGLKLLSPLTPEETYATIVKEGMKLVKAEYGSIFIGESKSGLRRVYASAEHLYAYKIRENGYHFKAFTQKRPMVLTAAEISKVHPDINQNGIQSTIIIPLSYKNEAIGVLSVDSRIRAQFTKHELSILKLFGSLASLAVRKTQLYDETKNALDMRNKFISLIAHELRTPLTSIHGYLQLMIKKINTNDKTDSNWIYDMYAESLKLTNLINELVEVNHIETGKQLYNFRESDVNEVILQAIKQIKHTYPQREIIYNPIANVYVIADPDKLKQVIVSMLDNAFKFSAKDTKVELTLKTQKKFLTISIKDYGTGIKKEDLPHVFEGFYKGQNNQQVGMGLGLLLAKSIIQKHHGTIIMASKEKKGTELKIKLPVIEL